MIDSLKSLTSDLWRGKIHIVDRKMSVLNQFRTKLM